MRWAVDGVRNVIRHFGTGNEKIHRLKRRNWWTAALSES